MSEPSRDSSLPPHPTAILLLWLAVPVLFVAAGGFVLWVLGRDGRARADCTRNLQRIAQALEQYHEAHSSFPPAYFVDAKGRKTHSWRVMILPELGYADLYARYRLAEAWDSPHNRGLIAEMPEEYACDADQTQARGDTNYFAIVGMQTIWPEQYAARKANVIDGLDLTLQVVESCGLSIPWTEPRDLSLDDAIKGINSGLAPCIASHHDGGAHVTHPDGTVRFLPESLIEGTIRPLCTIARNAPLAGGIWNLPGFRGPSESQAMKAASELIQTDIVPALTCPITSQRNVVYCATAQIAWDHLRDSLGVRELNLEPASATADLLNRGRFPASSLAPSSFVTITGGVRDNINDRIAMTLSERFPHASLPQLESPSGEELLLFCFLQKRLPFVWPFDRLRQPVQFLAGDQTDAVESFGLEYFRTEGDRVDDLRSQIELLEYHSDNEFMVRLRTQSDWIYLAKIAAEPTLAETWQRVADVSGTSEGQTLPHLLTLNEPFAVPLLALFVNKRFEELERAAITNLPPGFSSVRFQQIIKFQLDEAGSALESEVEWIITWGEEERPVGERSFIFDRPFLIALQEPQADEPYFVAWIANSELMAPSGN